MQPPPLFGPSVADSVGLGLEKALLTTVKPFYFIISDSETDDSSDTPLHTTATEKAKTQPITPSKSSFSYEPSQSMPPNHKRGLINEIFSSLPKLSQPSFQSKKPTPRSMKTKTTMTIAQFLARNKLKNPQRTKTPLTPERSPVRIPSPSPQQERFSHQERSPTRSSSPSHPQQHSPIPETSPIHTSSPLPNSKRSPNLKRSSLSTSEASPPSKKSKPNTLPLISPKNFKDKWAKRPIGIERVFVFDKLIVNGNNVQHHIDALGWTSFLQTSEHYYPDVVRAFYCNAKTFSDKLLIISNIKGIEIRLTLDILASILRLPTEGPSIFGNKWYLALNLKETEVLSDLFQEGSTRYLSTYLKPLPKVFKSMSQHTLLPHSGSHEYVSANDALIIYHLLNCNRLNLPHVIIQHMICAATKDYKKNIVPYGMILTKIFRHFGIPLSTEKSLIKISKSSTKNLSHMRKTFFEQPTPTISSFPTSLKRK
uniref:Uncharacterized protein LOC101505536 n=1 Tax=Cicer arietinum TaxID=3827 RepID=A0A1S2Z6J5_CICAR|nr:uncharacterized protein LOC101505536 [Cicer arietinum]